jgi:PAS domain S-box-containing protein
MKEKHQTKAQLLAEIAALRQQVAELQAAAPVCQRQGKTGEDGAEDEQGESNNTCSQAILPDPFEISAVLGVEQRRIEAALRESEERLRLVMQMAPVLLYDLDVKNGTFWGNNGSQRLFKLEPPPGFGSDWWQTQIHPEDRSATLASLQAALASGEQFWTGEYRSSRGDGSYAYVVNRAHFVRNAAGDLVRLVGAATDISQRKQTEMALQESEARYRMLFENANDAFAVVNLDRTIANINHAMEKLLGWSREELIGQDYYQVLTPAGIALAEERACRLQAGEKIPSIFEHEFRRKDGSTVLVEGRIRFIRDQAGTPNGFQGIYRDITERKQAEEALRKSEERYRSLVEATAQIVWTADCQGEVTESTKWDTLTGLSEENAKGWNWAKAIHPEDRQRTVERWSSAVATQTPYEDECRIREKGGEYRHFAVRAVPVLDNAGSIREWVGTSIDITTRKQAEEERQRLQAQLFQAQKLEAVGTLAGGIAHDFNNILTVMLGCTELAMDEVPVATEAYANLEEVLKAGRRAKALVQQILAFSRSNPEERQQLCLQSVVEESLTFLSAILPKTVKLYHSLACPIDTILANSTQIQQVIINLGINAIQAMEEKGGILQVGLQRIMTADYLRRTLDGLPLGPCLALTVHDTGCGMGPKVLERMYEPFFTTKAVGKGTGLGLAVVHGIVKNHGGAITVDSQPGQGTTFSVYFPFTTATMTPGSENREQPPNG